MVRGSLACGVSPRQGLRPHSPNTSSVNRASVQTSLSTPKVRRSVGVEPCRAPNALKSSLKLFCQCCAGWPGPGSPPPSSLSANNSRFGSRLSGVGRSKTRGAIYTRISTKQVRLQRVRLEHITCILSLTLGNFFRLPRVKTLRSHTSRTALSYAVRLVVWAPGVPH